ncbi:hypothetical protein ACWM35_06740 [Neobacillus sp. K501]
MLIISIFEQSIELEQALAELEKILKKENILVVFMDKDENANIYGEHSPHAFEIGISVGTGAAVIGASAGFVLTLGPILWGLIGAFSGFFVGIGSYFLVKKLMAHSKRRKNKCEVTVIIECTRDKIEMVNKILWKYKALSVGNVEKPSMNS